MNKNVQDTIVIVIPGPIPATNLRAADIIEARFPEFSVERIDLKQHLQENYVDLLKATWSAFLDYAPEIALRRRRLGEILIRSRSIRRIVHREIRKRTQGKLAFTFQMQSLFDSSIAGVPHFLYTDHTGRANLHYPHFSKAKMEKRSFLDAEPDIFRNAISFTWSENIRKSIITDYGVSPDRAITALSAPNVVIEPVAPSVGEDMRRNTILFVGIDWERKGGPDLVAAFKNIAKDRPNARLRIVGSNPSVDHPQIKVVGRVPMESVVQEFANAAIFCLPTYVEPFGIAFLDAMSQSAAIVGTEIGAIPEIVDRGNTGLLVTPGDLKSLANALIELLDNPDRANSMGKLGRERLIKVFTWQAVGDRIEKGIRLELARRKSANSGTGNGQKGVPA